VNIFSKTSRASSSRISAREFAPGSSVAGEAD
jgi:hypothetical protein